MPTDYRHKDKHLRQIPPLAHSLQPCQHEVSDKTHMDPQPLGHFWFSGRSLAELAEWQNMCWSEAPQNNQRKTLKALTKKITNISLLPLDIISYRSDQINSLTKTDAYEHMKSLL